MLRKQYSNNNASEFQPIKTRQEYLDICSGKFLESESRHQEYILESGYSPEQRSDEYDQGYEQYRLGQYVIQYECSDYTDGYGTHPVLDVSLQLDISLKEWDRGHEDESRFEEGHTYIAGLPIEYFTD